MRYEIAYIQDGELVRGGVAASLQTVGRWIESYKAVDPERTYVAVPASENALTQKERLLRRD